MNTCKNCMYWEELNTTDGAGECHFNPPVYGDGDPDEGSCFPFAWHCEWCGKWTKDRKLEDTPPRPATYDEVFGKTDGVNGG